MAKAQKAASKTATKPMTTSSTPSKTAPRENAANAQVPTYRVDQGESLPPQAPFPTATDKHK